MLNWLENCLLIVGVLQVLLLETKSKQRLDIRLTRLNTNCSCWLHPLATPTHSHTHCSMMPQVQDTNVYRQFDAVCVQCALFQIQIFVSLGFFKFFFNFRVPHTKISQRDAKLKILVNQQQQLQIVVLFVHCCGCCVCVWVCWLVVWVAFFTALITHFINFVSLFILHAALSRNYGCRYMFVYLSDTHHIKFHFFLFFSASSTSCGCNIACCT